MNLTRGGGYSPHNTAYSDMKRYRFCLIGLTTSKYAGTEAPIGNRTLGDLHKKKRGEGLGQECMAIAPESQI